MRRTLLSAVLFGLCAASPALADRVVYYNEYGEPVYRTTTRRVYTERYYDAQPVREYRRERRDYYYDDDDRRYRTRYRDRDRDDHSNDHILPHHRILHRLFGF